MTTCEIVKYIRFLSNKHQVGDAFTPEDINLAFKNVNDEVFNLWLTKFAAGQPIPEPLMTFITNVSAGTISGGTYTLPAALRRMVGNMSCIIDGNVVPLDLVDEGTFNYLKSFPGRNLSRAPVAVLRGGVVNVIPTNAGSINITYIRYPLVPVYDYYVDEYANEVCLEPGDSHTLGSGEYGSAGQTSGTTVSSTAVDIEWHERIHEHFVSRMLGKLGINILEPGLVQFSETGKAQQIQTQ